MSNLEREYALIKMRQARAKMLQHLYDEMREHEAIAKTLIKSSQSRKKVKIVIKLPKTDKNE